MAVTAYVSYLGVPREWALRNSGSRNQRYRQFVHLTLDGVRFLDPSALGTPIQIYVESSHPLLGSIFVETAYVGLWENVGVIPPTFRE